ncbi:phosphoribosyltransferase-like protein [Apodospora peruviana]|uniref:adenine phosphoribosyltransferase n=1 Tax=Apodospora peruviana TaxID=516989 RepID=A0AAE0MEI6_9PEZI|nr:phosphoribosyltransferase-like protein [Apodospora peruviana]
MSPSAEAAQNLASTRPDQTSSETQTNTAATASTASNDASGRQPTSTSASAAELARTKISLLGALKTFPDFPIPGIQFIDILPLFQDHAIHTALVRALELQVLNFAAAAGSDIPFQKPDVIVGLDARGFLFGPSLALRLNAGFVPVRKQGKMPGPCVTAAYEKEYGTDYFQIQEGAIKPGQKVLVVDDIIATGGSAAAAGSLVKQLGGELMGYLFILEIPFLKGREKLDGVATVTLLETDGK